MEVQVPKDVLEMLKQTRLDAIKKQLVESKRDNLRDATSALILTPTYSGTRTSWRCYHPLKCQNSSKAFDFAKRNFMAELKAWYDVVELYSDEMPLSEPIFAKAFKKNIEKLLVEIEKERDPYLIESLSAVLWDKEGSDLNEEGKYDKSEKTSQHDLTSMQELKQMAEELRHQDFGVEAKKRIGESDLTQHGWGG